MTTWTIIRTDTDELLTDGQAPDVRLAWARVIPAVMHQLATDPTIPGIGSPSTTVFRRWCSPADRTPGTATWPSSGAVCTNSPSRPWVTPCSPEQRLVRP